MPNALLLGYDLQQPSFRHRMRSIVGALAAAGWEVREEEFPSGRYGLRTWQRRKLLRWADVVVLHQIKLSGPEARLMAAFSRRSIFDVDDAIYVRKPRRLGEPAGESVWRRRKFAATCRWVDVVGAGNQVLADVAWRTARDIVILPTSIDVGTYRPSHATAGDAPTIVWIGSPENLIYLDMVRPALARLSLRHPRLRLRVICSAFPDWPGIHIDRVPWSAATEAEALAAAHIGIMPLTDDEWARGKCAFKLLQYMAAALPCVASPVGANTEAVLDGVNGLHARNDSEWEQCLGRLIESPELRARFGAAGLAHVGQRYAMQTYRTDYVRLFDRLRASGVA